MHRTTVYLRDKKAQDDGQTSNEFIFEELFHSTRLFSARITTELIVLKNELLQQVGYTKNPFKCTGAIQIESTKIYFQ